MRRSARAMRRTVLGEMFKVLEHTYGTEFRRDDFVNGVLSPHEIDGILSFKSDPRLDELRRALDRIEDGTFGLCIGCKHEIPQQSLAEDPTRRMCNICESEFNKPSVEHEYHWVH